MINLNFDSTGNHGGLYFVMTPAWNDTRKAWEHVFGMLESPSTITWDPNLVIDKTTWILPCYREIHGKTINDTTYKESVYDSLEVCESC